MRYECYTTGSRVICSCMAISSHSMEGSLGRGDRVMASLFDGDEVPGAYGDADWVQVVRTLGY